MSFWRENNFFMNFKNHIVKWYQTVLLPVFHIDNSGSKQRFHTEGEEPETPAADGAVSGEADAEASEGSKTASGGGTSSGKTVTMPGMNKKGPVASGDAQAVLDRINNDREGKHFDEVEKARKEAEAAKRKAEEEARLASIMNANKVDVDSFIAQGKNAAQEAKEAEELKRAQEIIDRLNSEAAADEAAKQAEIEEAKRKAAEQAGAAGGDNNASAAGESGGDGAGSQGDKEAEEMRRAQEIFERLQREAAEDEAAKQAELDAAMAEAAAKFGN
ncbi:MAG: hypothetical protein IJ661_12010 [Lachnospiraceae bacterium]|nr:hypothetical protein [Lachnospiraceae bacterium]